MPCLSKYPFGLDFSVGFSILTLECKWSRNSNIPAGHSSAHRTVCQLTVVCGDMKVSMDRKGGKGQCKQENVEKPTMKNKDIGTTFWMVKIK
jgi:hypothetical protein